MEQQVQTGGIKRHSKYKIIEGRQRTYHWFTVTGNNNKVLVTSEMYKSKQSLEKGIAALDNIMTLYHFGKL